MRSQQPPFCQQELCGNYLTLAPAFQYWSATTRQTLSSLPRVIRGKGMGRGNGLATPSASLRIARDSFITPIRTRPALPARSPRSVAVYVSDTNPKIPVRIPRRCVYHRRAPEAPVVHDSLSDVAVTSLARSLYIKRNTNSFLISAAAGSRRKSEAKQRAGRWRIRI